MDSPVDLPKELTTLANLIQSQPTCFSAAGNTAVNAAALDATNSSLTCVLLLTAAFSSALKAENESRPHIIEFLSSLSPSEAPQTRSQATKKRKRGSSPSPPPPPPMFEPTPIASLFTDGMDDDQIWAQLELRMKPVCDMLELALDADPSQEEELDTSDREGSVDEDLLEQMRALESGEFEGMDVDDLDDEESDSEEAESEEESDDNGDLGEGVTSLRDPSSDEDSEPEADPAELFAFKPKRSKSSAGSKSGLDDGFFELASFNAETEEAEARKVSRGRLDGDDSEDEGSIDLFAPVDVAENFDEEDEDEAGELFYKDFFEPPRTSAPPRPKKTPTSPKKAGTVRFHEEVRVKKIKAKGKNLPLNTMDDDSDEEDDEEDGYGDFGDLGGETGFGEMDDGSDEGEEDGDEGSEPDSDGHSEGSSNGAETIERLKSDLFAEEEDEPSHDLSTHEQRMAALQEQIASLEAENVGPKDWRVPVVTEETVLALEERIKARILDGRFDDVVRIRPMEDKPFLASRFFELKDTKSSQSLAQIYEEEYVAQTTGTAVDDRDGKLTKEHAELEALWEGICGKLDALCNAHFMPKQPKATISSISNVSSATLESALPTTKSAATMLAPEEVFATASSDPRARSELTPAEKKALRGKERKAKQKSRDKLNNSVDKYAKLKGIGGIKKQKQAALASVVKTGKKMGKPRPRKPTTAK
ncbi:Mpp10 protein-domain-containing protein [Mycena olivaceomarginata]|nr:Mpp10 protein-domain-containing protein [Mycena olivaceomarginata]